MSFARYISKLAQLLNSSGQVLTTGHADGSVTPAKLSADAQYMGMKNRIINGAMMIDQRNAGAALTQTNGTLGDAYSVDRWIFGISVSTGGTGSRTIQQVSDAPTGFSSSLKYTLTTVLSSSRISILSQRIEGYNCVDLASQSATVSFYAKASRAGNVNIIVDGSTSTTAVAVALTTSWAQYTVNVTMPAGAVTNFTTGSGYILNIRLTDFTSASDTVNITGVQLEKGSTATSFDYRPYGTELQLCQRYLPCYNATSASAQTLCSGFAATTTIIRAVYPLKVNPRVPPSGVTVSSAAHFNFGGAGTAPSAITFESGSIDACSLQLATTGATSGSGSYLYSVSASAKIQFTGCEL